jgi:hypothetical protein
VLDTQTLTYHIARVIHLGGIMRSFFFLLILLATTAMGSVRGSAPDLNLQAHPTLLDPGEAYQLSLEIQKPGFVYIYSIDPDGYIQLLYPVLEEDGRGRVQSGQRLLLDPIYAGQMPGMEELIAVQTKDYRAIKASRRHFLAPNPNDIEDINARLTRRNSQLKRYTRASIDIFGTAAPDLEEVGLVIHEHHYNFWCDYCDCWHMPCTHHHCYCGWEVMHHYHNHYHYSHCGLWGAWHSWWSPPVIYIYIQGGSAWDYDTSPWRNQRVWRRYHGYSERWRRDLRPRMREKEDAWRGLRERKLDTPEPADIRKPYAKALTISEAPLRIPGKATTPLQESKRFWNTDQPESKAVPGKSTKLRQETKKKSSESKVRKNQEKKTAPKKTVKQAPKRAEEKKKKSTPKKNRPGEKPKKSPSKR